MGVARFIAGYEGPRHAVPAMSEVRSTWLTSSVLGVREHGHYDRYAAALDPQFRDLILTAVPGGSWIPVAAFAAHYAACDSLDLPEEEKVALGERATRQIHGTMIDLARRLAREAGATPWALLGHAPKLFERVARGGSVRVNELGPKEAQLELLGYPVARYSFARCTMRGAVRSLASIFGHSTYVHDVRGMCTPASLGYRVQWA
jgi:hypothetical protein